MAYALPPDRGGVARRRACRVDGVSVRAIDTLPPHAVDAITSRYNTRRDKLPLVHGASLITKDAPFQDQFDVVEDLMLTFCERVALPCFLCRDANPDLYSYCPVPLTVRGTQTLVSFAPLAFKLFCAARQNAVLRRSPFP